jgi:hypothetical protein
VRVNSAPLRRSPAIDFTGYRQIAATFIGILPLHERQRSDRVARSPRVFSPPMKTQEPSAIGFCLNDRHNLCPTHDTFLF